MIRAKKEWLVKLLLISMSLFASIAVSDMLIRAMRLPADNSRVMFLSESGLFTDSKTGIRKYKPNTNYRHVAVYDNKIEYDYIFSTDQHGFRQTYQCNRGIQAKTDSLITYPLAIAGDSFTEGQGSERVWVSLLQAQACRDGINSINAAIAAIGITDMKDSLTYAKNTLAHARRLLQSLPMISVETRFPCSAIKNARAT
jgi:hypothetical protein